MEVGPLCWLSSIIRENAVIGRDQNKDGKTNSIFRIKRKGKDKGHPRTGHEGPKREQMYSSTLPSTSALDVEWVVNAKPPAALPPGKTRYPLYRSLGDRQGRSGRVRKILPSPQLGFDPLTVQTVA